MSPKRLAGAGLALVLIAVLLLWSMSNAVEALEDKGFRYFEEITFAKFFAGSLGGAGILLILRGLWCWIFGNTPYRLAPRIFPEMPLRNLTKWRGQSSNPSLLMSSLQSFSVSWISVLQVLITIFMMFGPQPSKGLYIDWLERSHVSSAESPWAETMGVYVDGNGQFLVNGLRVRREELPMKLKEELGRRMVWTVYFEADQNSVFMDTAYAMDTIQGLGAKMVWITPKMREEMDRQRGWPSPSRRK